MRTIIAIMTMLWVCACAKTSTSDPLDIQLPINGTAVQGLRWHAGEFGALVWNHGLSKSATDEQWATALDSGPWYIWPADQDKLVIDISSFSGQWDPAIHGLYNVGLDSSSTRFVFRQTKGRPVLPDKVTDKTVVFDYDYNVSVDDRSQGKAYTLILMVITPCQDGGFLVSRHKKTKTTSFVE